MKGCQHSLSRWEGEKFVRLSLFRPHGARCRRGSADRRDDGRKLRASQHAVCSRQHAIMVLPACYDPCTHESIKDALGAARSRQVARLPQGQKPPRPGAALAMARSNATNPRRTRRRRCGPTLLIWRTSRHGAKRMSFCQCWRLRKRWVPTWLRTAHAALVGRSHCAGAPDRQASP
jgi:hypothetical protein